MSESAVKLHEMAPVHMPSFIPGADGSDGMFGTMTIFVLVGVFVVGILYLKLHSLPEHLAAGVGRAQYQLVGILALLALFTHDNVFWVGALLLAVVQIPDFITPLSSIAHSLDRMSRANGGPSQSVVKDSDASTGADQPIIMMADAGGNHNA